ncbi:N-acetyltransferase 10 [Massospora cicadina]|nr:N-acetyltransferase 10 [Massospora cicadina]
MGKKALDPRIVTLIKNNVQTRHRSMFVIVGDKGKDQVVNLHWLLSQTRVASRPTVLWCYKKDLGFTSNRKKREHKIRREVKRGIREANEEDPFEIFRLRHEHPESHKILGTTYGMCVLQDFEALTPNLLARTIETVEGGGIIVLLLRTMKSLKQLYTMTMDVHSRYRTEAHDDVVNRFNERFILSLGASETCLVVDDELNVLPISAAKNIKPLPATFKQEASEQETELQELKSSLVDTQPIGCLVATARTLDQGKALLTFVEAISEKTLRSTVTLTAGRGRGKSAALGMAISAAVAYGYSNIFVTSPHPDNLKTLFEFIFKGFDALDYSEHLDYDIVQSTNPDFNKAIVRVNVFRQHRQTIQYIQPQDHATLAQAELLVIDEAAAIPLPLVKKLLGPYLVFMASTINGYEGTGRSLSLKLIQQLREESRGAHLGGGRSLREVKLEEPIRYAPGDPIELWLNKLLCLDASAAAKNISGCPHPDTCELFYVHRDTLFSYHPVSETFLQRMMALYVASHYKNSPNDLQLMSDAPSHHLFVLLPPVSPDITALPDPLVVVQVCLEGQISRQSVLNSLSRGMRASGDLIPWLVSQQFQDDDFASLSGARVVRIATHPDYTKMGYGARALRLLTEFYAGKFKSLDEHDPASFTTLPRVTDSELESADLTKDKIRVRDPRQMPPLLLRLSEVQAHPVHYLGVSYGLTRPLHTFWKRVGFVPLYVRQTPNDLTGEHTCVMLKPLDARQDLPTRCSGDWMAQFAKDFHRRFINLLAYQFRSFDSTLALSILEAAYPKEEEPGELSSDELAKDITSYDMKRLESYANNLLDYHVIMDLVPRVANYHFGHRLPTVKFSAVQNAILLSIGLQHKTFEGVSAELGLPVSQLLALFAKAIKKAALHFREVVTQDLARRDPQPIQQPQPHKRNIANDAEWDPLTEDVERELDDAGRAALAEVRDRQREFLDAIDLSRYAITGAEADFEAAATSGKLLPDGNTLISVPTSNPKRGAKREAAAGLAARLAQLHTPNPNGIPKAKKKKIKKN